MMFRAYLEKRLPTRPLRRQEVYNSHISHTVVSKGTISGLRNQPFTCPYDNVDSVFGIRWDTICTREGICHVRILKEIRKSSWSP